MAQYFRLHPIGPSWYPTDGKSFQQMAGSMTGMTEDEYRNMMINGGRSVEGNRFVGENGDAQTQNQPQGSAGKKAH